MRRRIALSPFFTRRLRDGRRRSRRDAPPRSCPARPVLATMTTTPLFVSARRASFRLRAAPPPPPPPPPTQVLFQLVFSVLPTALEVFLSCRL